MAKVIRSHEWRKKKTNPWERAVRDLEGSVYDLANYGGARLGAAEEYIVHNCLEEDDQADRTSFAICHLDEMIRDFKAPVFRDVG